MAKRDFIISFFAQTPFLKAMLDQLEAPYLLFQPSVANRDYKNTVLGLGNSVIGMWNSAPGKSPGDELGRVAVLSFSEGCMGGRAMLEATDASAIDAVIACDGIHTQKLGPALEMSRLGPYISFGRLAASAPPSQAPNTKLLVITHSAIGAASLPSGTASTTQTGEVIWNEVTKSIQGPIETAECVGCPAATNITLLSQIVWPNGFPVGTTVGPGKITSQGWTTTRPSAPETNFLQPADFTWSGFADGWNIRRVANNFYVFGWSYDTTNKTKDPTGNRDHVFQANMVLPYVALELLVRRWNPMCGPTSGYGLGDDAASCSVGGQGYHDQQAQPLPDPFAMGIPLPRLPDNCPPPPPGHVIIGKEGDPCWAGVPTPPVSGESLTSTIDKLIIGVTGAAAGWVGASWFMKHRSKVKHKRA